MPMFQPGQIIAPGAYYNQGNPAYPPGYPPHQQPMYGQLDRAYSNASSYGQPPPGHGMQQGAAVSRQPSAVSNYGPSGPVLPDPFAERSLSPLNEGEEPLRSGTPDNPNPQQTYYHRHNDSANSTNQAVSAAAGAPGAIEYVAPTRDHDDGWNEMRAKRTLSVRNGGLDAPEFDDKRNSASSDAYGGIVRRGRGRGRVWRLTRIPSSKPSLAIFNFDWTTLVTAPSHFGPRRVLGFIGL
jgi:hypothetical protein